MSLEQEERWTPMQGLASICDAMGWELSLDPYWHDHGYDREGWLTVRTPEIVSVHKAAGESWDKVAERLRDKLAEGLVRESRAK